MHIFKNKSTNNFTPANHFIRLKMSSCLQSSQIKKLWAGQPPTSHPSHAAQGSPWMANYWSPHLLVKAERLYLTHNLSRPLDLSCLDWQSRLLFASPLTLSFSNCPLGSKEHPTRPLKCWTTPWHGEVFICTQRKNWDKYVQLWFMTGCRFLTSNFLTFSLIITIINLARWELVRSVVKQ